MLTSLVHGLTMFSWRVNRVCWWLAGVALIVMLFSVGVQVLGRYLLFAAPAWTEELARYAMVWAGLLGATVSFHEGEDPVIVRPGFALSRWAEWVRAVPVFIFVVPLIVYSPVIVMHHMDRLTDSLQVTSGYVIVIVPVFAWVVALHQVSRLLETLVVDNSVDRELT